MAILSVAGIIWDTQGGVGGGFKVRLFGMVVHSR